jgi:hypothetical protein
MLKDELVDLTHRRAPASTLFTAAVALLVKTGLCWRKLFAMLFESYY